MNKIQEHIYISQCDIIYLCYVFIFCIYILFGRWFVFYSFLNFVAL